MRTYYNEWDQQAAAWIDALIDRDVVSVGPVDTRDIEDVLPSDLKGYERVHLFAGIATWDAALTLAGWPAGRDVWTVSCPCQPFSAAGKRQGTADKRHLWPAVDWLVGQRRPHTIFGEQVASKDGRAWFDHVQADLEARGYAIGSAVTPAAGYGAPHERHRLYFVATLADDKCDGWQGSAEPAVLGTGWRDEGDAIGCGSAPLVRSSDRLEQPGSIGWERGQTASQGHNVVGSSAGRSQGQHGSGEPSAHRVRSPGPTNGYWRDADWLGCRDDRWRPVEPGTFPLAHGASARVGRLRGYGNGIVLPQAVAFIQSFLEGEADWHDFRAL